MIHFACACGANLKAADAIAGSRAHCPQCGTRLEVPQSPSDPPGGGPSPAAAGPRTQGPAEPGGPSWTLSRLAKAELFRRTGGQCSRCRKRQSLTAVHFYPNSFRIGAAGAPAADWEVLCPSCYEEARSPITRQA